MEHHVLAGADVAAGARVYYKRGGGWPGCLSVVSGCGCGEAWRERGRFSWVQRVEGALCTSWRGSWECRQQQHTNTYTPALQAGSEMWW